MPAPVTVATDFRQQLAAAQARNASLLCVGLDPEPARFPAPWRDDPARIFDFCASIVDATHDLVCCFKPQIAHFAAQRAEDQLERLLAHIRRVAPEVPVILDAKRGDIGSTAEQYAREAFVRYQADALTLSPLLGLDSIEPFMRYNGRGLILLCRTSNPGGSELQSLPLQSSLPGGELLYERIARLAGGEWNRGGQIGLVVGATFPRELARVRALAPTLPILIPGVGAQGGDAEATVRAAWRPAMVGNVGNPGNSGNAGNAGNPGNPGNAADAGDAGGLIIVSSSRAVLYASAGADFASAARSAALAARAQLHQAQVKAQAQAQAQVQPPTLTPR